VHHLRFVKRRNQIKLKSNALIVNENLTSFSLGHIFTGYDKTNKCPTLQQLDEQLF